MKKSTKPTKRKHSYPNIQAWMSANIEKDSFDYYVNQGHKLIRVGVKTWYHYRHGKVHLNYAKRLAIEKMLGHLGFSFDLIKGYA